MDRQYRIERAVVELDGVWPKDDPEIYHILVDVSSTKDRDGESYNAWADGWVGHQHGWFPVCTYPEFMEARKRLENKPSWDDAPEWAGWLAQDSTGRWEFYAKKPKPRTEVWGPRDIDGVHRPMGHVFTDWRKSLERRPESNPDQETATTRGANRSHHTNNEHHDHKDGEGVKWDGDIPPAGVECEFRAKGGSLDYGQNIDWKPCEVIVTTRAYAILRHIGKGYTDNHECSHSLSRIEFRPIQSHRDKVIEAAERVIEGVDHQIIAVTAQIAALYDAGMLDLPKGER